MDQPHHADLRARDAVGRVHVAPHPGDEEEDVGGVGGRGARHGEL